MGYCHRCQHDCTDKDPCPCCRGTKYRPWFNPPDYEPRFKPGIQFTCENLKPRTKSIGKILTGVR